MRLWHEKMIMYLPRQQLLGQHRECAALRGGGWGKAHATVNYVFDYPPYKLYQYHVLIMEEMRRRGYQPDVAWNNPLYRGKSIAPYCDENACVATSPLYPEHNADYLAECLENLKQKGIDLDIQTVMSESSGCRQITDAAVGNAVFTPPLLD